MKTQLTFLLDLLILKSNLPATHNRAILGFQYNYSLHFQQSVELRE